MDHRTVTADIGLHDMCGNDVRQYLLQDVVGLSVAQQVAMEHGLHAGQATDTGALRAGHQARMNPPHQLLRGEPGGKEGIDGGDHVPQCHPVHGRDHVGTDTPDRRVEPGRDLAAHGARQFRLARHPDLGTRLANDLPVTGVSDRADHGVLWVGVGECPGLGLRGHHERKVSIEEHADE